MSYIALEESAFGVSFLDRLEADAKPLTITQAPELDEILVSIKRNISSILNTRIGDCESNQSLGLIDFNDATLEPGDLAMTIRLSIKQCLDRFEPRLKNISVYSDSGVFESFYMHFQVKAQLNHSALHEKVKLQLMLDNNKQYRVF